MPTSIIMVLSVLAIIVVVWPVLRSLVNRECRYLFCVYEGPEMLWDLPIRGSHDQVRAEINELKAHVAGSQYYVIRRLSPVGWEVVERSPIPASPVRV